METGDFKLSGAYVEVYADDSKLRRDVRDLPKKVAPESKKAGEGIGDALSEGMRQSVVRNSPVIAAAVGGGLALGAPLAMAGATVLFGGIAAAALSQNDRIKSSYAGLGNYIKKAAADDAAVLVPTFERTADRIGEAFTRLRPTMQATFAATGPQIDELTDGLISLAEQGINGAAYAAQNAQPVMSGLSSMLDKTGSGLEGFFVELSAGADGGGKTLDALGDIMDSLLPTLGQLLGVASQFGGQTLPIVASALGVTTDILGVALDIIEPLAGGLGSVTGYLLAGVAAWKLYGAASGAAGQLTDRLASSGNKVQEGLSRVSGSLPIVGAALVGVGYAYDQTRSKAEEFTQGVLAGSMTFQEAINAERNQIEKRVALTEALASSTGEVVVSVNAEAEAHRNVTGQIGAQLASMGPLARSTAEVHLAQGRYQDALRDYGPTSSQAQIAAQSLGAATDRAKIASEQATQATKSYSQSLTELSGIMQGAIGSSLSYEQSTHRLKDASNAAAQAERDHGTASTQYRDAALALQQQVDAVAQAAQRNTQAQNASKGETEATRLGAEAYRAELNRLATDQDGRVRAAALSNIARLGETELQAFDAANRTSGLRTELVKLPDGRTVHITTPGLAEATSGIRGLQTEITKVNGKEVSIYVSALGKGGLASAGRIATGGVWMGPGDVIARANGGVLPGYTPGRDVHRFVGAAGTLDLSGGEAIMRPEWTRAVGTDWVKRMNRIARTGGAKAVQEYMSAGEYANGGVIPLTLRAKFTDQVGSIQGAVDGFNEKAIGLGQKAAGMTLGGGSGIGGYHWQMNVLRSRFPGLQLISGFRPGAITATGNKSYHGKGRAVDVPPRMDVFNWIKSTYGRNTKELIFSPAGGGQVWNGRNHMYTGVTRANHWDHVHWAYDQGGIASGPGLLPKITREPERVLSPRQTEAFERLVDHLTAGGGAYGDRPVVVNVQQTSGGPTETGRFVALALRSV